MFDYLVVAELAYDSQMFQRLFMGEGEFCPGFESGLDGHVVEMFDAPRKEAALFDCVCGQRGQ